MSLQPRIIQRTARQDVLTFCKEQGLSEIMSMLIAQRIREVPAQAKEHGIGALLRPKLSLLNHYSGLPDIHIAAQRIAKAIMRKEHIAIVTDHDVDGMTSHAVIYSALVRHFKHPASNTHSFIGHRLNEGYGLSMKLTERILSYEVRPSLIITADHGSSDEERIAILANHGIDVVVTDHHDMPEEGSPKSAKACVTPKGSGCEYPDPLIAGVMVAWLTMTAVRALLIEVGFLPKDQPKLTDLLDFVCCGTVADCVSLGESINNRAVVNSGLQLINSLTRPCWRAMRQMLWGDGKFTAADIAWGIGPRLNARGRLDEAMAGVRFLLAESDEEAVELAGMLETENTERKQIEKQMKAYAIAEAQMQVDQGRNSLVIWLPDGHAGVHGIVASRIVEAFGRPVICLSPKVGHPDLITGSARAIPEVHIREAMQSAYDEDSSYFVAFGGHQGAGGCTIQKIGLSKLQDAFERAINKQLEAHLKTTSLGPIVFTDGTLPSDLISLDTLNEINALEPFGREFESPVFDGEFWVREAKPVGNDGSHLKLTLTSCDSFKTDFSCIWFNAIKPEDEAAPINMGDRIKAVYTLDKNEYRGSVSIQGKIILAYPI